MTAFLSMWISNTATAAMMLPISHAVLQEIKKQCIVDAQGNSSHSTNENVTLVSAKYVKNYDGISEDDGQVVLGVDEDKQTIPIKNEHDGLDEEKCDETAATQYDKDTHLDRSFSRLSKGLTLGIAYSANIGGTGTLTGTGPNLVLSGDVAQCV